MTIESTHPLYKPDYYNKCNDCFEGNVVDYVPRLRGQTVQEYEAYRTRASFFNVVEKTTNIIIGILTRKKPIVNGSDTIVCANNQSFDEFIHSCYKNILLGSRIGILVDYDELNNTPYLSFYTYPTITNWSDNFVVLREDFYLPSEKDRYEHTLVTQYRELTFDENNQYQVVLWRQTQGMKFGVYDIIQPLVNGKPLNYIPFFPINQFDTSFNEYKPLLLNLANLNLEHFKLSVDLAHGLHFTALPQPYISGDFAGEHPTTVSIGSPNIWQLSQGTQVGYLEFTGNGLSKIENAIESKQLQMSIVSSRMLQQDKKGIEAAETINIRMQGENASLIAMVSSLESGINQALQTYSLWLGKQVSVQFNRDLVPTVNTEIVKVLIDAYNQGVISLETLIEKMYENEMIDDVQQELNRLQTNKNKS